MARSIVFLSLLALVIAGCASGDDDDGSTSTTSTSTSASATVSASGTISGSVSISGTGAPGTGVVHKTIIDDSYPSGDFTIKRGQSVNWTATTTSHPHSVSSDTALFDSSPTCSGATVNDCLNSGETYQYKFDAVGTFPYHCRIHPTTMKGTITVTN